MRIRKGIGIPRPTRGYTIKVCMCCGHDAIIPCLRSRTPLCDECLGSHRMPWEELAPSTPALDLPPVPRQTRVRTTPGYVPPIPPLGRAKRRRRVSDHCACEVAA